MPVPVAQVMDLDEEWDCGETDDALAHTPAEDEGAGYPVPGPVTPQGALEDTKLDTGRGETVVDKGRLPVPGREEYGEVPLP